MSNTMLRCGNTILPQTGKKGILTPDKDGYFAINGGSFGRENRSGIVYAPNDYIVSCLSPDSLFKIRLNRGDSYAEKDHPKMYYKEKINGEVVITKMTNILEWTLRLKSIDTDRVCGHVSDIVFDTDNFNFKTKEGYIDFICLIKPEGVYKQEFLDNVTNPRANTSLSIRTITEPQRFGDRVRQVEHWTGVDWVPDAGFSRACKFKTAGLEGFIDSYNEEDETMEVSKTDFINIIENGIKDQDGLIAKCGLESFNQLSGMLDEIKQSTFNDRSGSSKVSIKCYSQLDIF